MADVGWGDLIDHLGDDPETDAIVLYMETVGDARAFLSATREVARTKPVIVMKPDRRGAACGGVPYRVADRERRGPRRGVPRAGVLRAERISTSSISPRSSASSPAPGPRLTVLSNAEARPRDRHAHRGGGKLAELAPTRWRRSTRPAADLEPRQPGRHHRRRTPERYAAALEVVTRDPGSDGLLVILTPRR